MAASMRAAGVEPPAPEQLADDFIRVACEAMARAIKRISTQRGHDVTGHVLCCFGGAAGQHACLVADALGMTQVLLHPLAGVLSAYGMGLADVRALRERSVEAPLEEAGGGAAAAALAELEAAAVAELELQGIPAAEARVERRGHVKYQGTDVALPVPWAAPDDDGGRVPRAAPRPVRVPDARARPHARGRRRRGGRRRRRQRTPGPSRGRRLTAPERRARLAPRAPRPRETARLFTGGAHGTRRRCTCARTCAPGATDRGAGDRLRAHRARPSWSPAGGPRCWPAASCCCAGPRRRPAPRPTPPTSPRCCSRSSTASSCRSPSRWARRSPTPRSR